MESDSLPTVAGDAETVFLLARSGEDLPEAMLEVYRRYGPMTHAFFRRRVGDPQTAADLNQDLYMDVLEGLPRFRGECPFRAWLFRLAHNRLEHLRRRWRVHLDERADEDPAELWEDLDTGSPAIEDALDRETLCRRLRTCLTELPEVERAVILGQYYQGVTLDELTRRLGLDNPSGARAILLAAQRRLRRCLERASGALNP